VTVLFADVKGSMELAEQLDPEEWPHAKASKPRSPRRPR
jgi:class 3 adenylate cyclase